MCFFVLSIEIGQWRETLEFIARAYKDNSSVRSLIEGERNIQGFFTAYLSISSYYLTAPEMELNHGFCDMFLMPDLERYNEVAHSSSSLSTCLQRTMMPRQTSSGRTL